jgi:hypothetical protein
LIGTPDQADCGVNGSAEVQGRSWSGQVHLAGTALSGNIWIMVLWYNGSWKWTGDYQGLVQEHLGQGRYKWNAGKLVHQD